MQLTNQGQEKKTTDKGQVITPTVLSKCALIMIQLYIYFHNTTSIAIAGQTHTLILHSSHRNWLKGTFKIVK